MKSFSLFSLAAAATTVLGAAIDIAPEITTSTETQTKRAGAIVKKIRYGPFHMAAAAVNEKGDLVGTQFNQVIPGIKKPCKECYLQLITAKLEYANGTQTSNPGTYLHHIVVANAGYGVVDGTCKGPGIDAFFSSGNEQPSEIYNDLKATHNTGYHVSKQSNFFMNAFMLNNEPIAKDIYVALSYELIDGAQKDFTKTRVAWVAYGHTDCSKPIMDAEAADIKVPNETGFTLTSDPWVSPWSGDILITGGHMHSGGLYTKIYKNGEVLCDSVASYTEGTGMAMMGERRRLRRDGAPVALEGGKSEYLSNMTSCASPGKIAKGDKIHLESKYDFTVHPGMKKEDGHIAPVMALAKFYIASEE